VLVGIRLQGRATLEGEEGISPFLTPTGERKRKGKREKKPLFSPSNPTTSQGFEGVDREKERKREKW